MIEGSRLPSERKSILPSPIFYLKKSFGYLHVRSPILTHRPKLNKMRMWGGFLHCPYQIKSSDDVILLRERGMLPINHAIGGRWLFTQMNDRIWLRFS